MFLLTTVTLGQKKIDLTHLVLLSFVFLNSVLPINDADYKEKSKRARIDFCIHTWDQDPLRTTSVTGSTSNTMKLLYRSDQGENDLFFYF